MVEEPEQIVVQKPTRTIGITIASISLIFVIFIVVLWGSGFLTFTGSDPSSKVIAAALALVGGLVAAVVSIVGILLKYSIDQRTESRLQIESDRAAAEREIESDRASALQTQAEQRLNLEAAIRAVQLLGADGANSAVQRAGALFALSNLEQHQLTLDLTAFLLESDSLEPNMAASLIDRALRRGDDYTQRQAIQLLSDNAQRMITPLGTSVPSSISDWDQLSLYVREWAVFTLGKLFMGRPLSVWQTEFWGEANALIAVLGLAWESESNERLKHDIGAILKSVLVGFPNSATIYHPKKAIDTDRLRVEVSEVLPSSNGGRQMVKKLESWKVAVPEPERAPGATASKTTTGKSSGSGMQLLYLSVAKEND